MSGGGGDVNARLTVDTAAFEAGMSQAGSSIQRLQSLSMQASNQMQAANNTAMSNIASSIQRMNGIAAAAYRSSGAEVTTAFNAMNTTAESAISRTRAALSGIAQSGEEAATSIGGVAVNAGMAREAIVLLHEAVSGNFNRIPGSLMVMGERMGGLVEILKSISGEVYGVGAAVIAVTGLFAYWAFQAAKVEEAIRGASAAAVEAGRSGPGARSDITRSTAEIYGTGTVSKSDAVELAAAINRINELTDVQRQKVASLAPAFLAMFDGDIKAAEKFIAEIFKGDAAFGKYLQDHHVLGTDGVRAWDETTDAAKRFEIGIQALFARLMPSYEEYAKKVRSLREDLRMIDLTAGTGMIGKPVGLPEPVMLRGNIPTGPGSVSELIDNTAKMMGLNAALTNLATKIAQTESGGRQFRDDGSLVLGPLITDPNSEQRGKRAIGAMQVMPDVAGGSIKTIDGQTFDLRDAAQNVAASLTMLNNAYKSHGNDIREAATSYIGRGTSEAAVIHRTQYLNSLGLGAGVQTPQGGPRGASFRPGLGEEMPGTRADPAAERQQRLTDENDYEVKKAQITSKITEQQKFLADTERTLTSAMAAGEGAQATAVIQSANARIEAIRRSIATLEEEKISLKSGADPGAQRQAAEAITQAKLQIAQTTPDNSSRAIANARAEMDVYKQAAAQVGISDGQKMEFDRQYAQANVQLLNALNAANGSWFQQRQSELLAMTAKETAAGGERIQIELRVTEATKNFWAEILNNKQLTQEQKRQAEDQYYRAVKRLAEEQATYQKEQQNKQLREVETGLNAQIAAARGNLAQIIALEQQRVDAVRTIMQGDSAALNQALTQQQNVIRQAAEALTRSQEQEGQRRIQQESASLDAQVAAHRINKTRKEQLLLEFVQTERDLEMQQLNNTIGMLQQGTAAYNQALEDKKKLQQKFEIEISRLRSQEMQSLNQLQQAQAAIYAQALDRIGGSFSGSLTGMITQTTTVMHGIGNIIRTMIQSTIDIILHLGTQWAATQLGMALASESTQNAIRAAQERGQTGMDQLILRSVGFYRTSETAKDTAASTGAATRQAIQTQENTTGNTGLTQKAIEFSTVETGKTQVTLANTSQRMAVATTENNVDNTGLVRKGTLWASAEAAKTSATVSGTATRTAVEQVASESEEVGFIVRAMRWVASEITKTTATAAGEATRTGIKTAAAVEGAAVEKSANLTTIAQDAYKAAAGAYAAVVGIPYIGPIIAPIAAAVAFAAVASFGSFDKGTSYVPEDMLAQIHQGEIIIPAAQSAKLRSTSVEGGGGSSLADMIMTGNPLAAAPNVDMSALMNIGSLPGLAVGAWDVPHDMVAQIHKDEMVVPASFADGMRTNLSTSTNNQNNQSQTSSSSLSALSTPVQLGDVHFNVTALDRKSVAAFFNEHGSTIAKQVTQAWTSNPSLRPRYS